MKALIGVDIGTQGTKAACFDEAGRRLAQAFEPSRLRRPAPGAVEEDPDRQVSSVCRTIRRCVREAGIGAGGAAGIGIDGQMAGILGVGTDGRAVTPYDSWLDTRCDKQIAQMQQVAGDEVLAKTGCAPSFNHGPKILRWKHAFPKVYRLVAAFVQPGGYAAMRLAGLDGRAAFIDSTYLHFSGFADNRRRRWDEGLCRTFGVDPGKLPRIVEPHEVVGGLTAAMARRCGLSAGVPIVAGCGDTAASFLACGAVREGICVDVAGTASVFAGTAGRFRPDRRHGVLGCGRAATPELWHPYAYINGGGMNLEWFREELARAGRRGGKAGADFGDLNRLAAKLPDGDEAAPLFVPHFGGRVCPPQPELRGAWVGLTWGHRLAHLYRAMLEGVALEYGIYQAVLAELYPRLKLRELRITGGGEQSAVWNRIKADVLQMPVVQVARGGGAPMGAAMLAARGVGVLPSLPAAARTWVERGARTTPRKRLAGHYRRRLERYRSVLELLRREST